MSVLACLSGRHLRWIEETLSLSNRQKDIHCSIAWYAMQSSHFANCDRWILHDSSLRRLTRFTASPCIPNGHVLKRLDAHSSAETGS
jgi:hypothetical protein